MALKNALGLVYAEKLFYWRPWNNYSTNVKKHRKNRKPRLATVNKK